MSEIKQRKNLVLENKQEDLSPKQKKHKSHAHKTMANTSGDWMNIIILLILYTLQGIPLGLSAAIPIIMQKKHITYKEQVK